MSIVAQRYDAVQYDGTNGAYIAGTWCTGITFVSDNGTTFVFRDGDGYQHSVVLDNWVVRSWNLDDAFPVVNTPAQYSARWIVITP